PELIPHQIVDPLHDWVSRGFLHWRRSFARWWLGGERPHDDWNRISDPCRVEAWRSRPMARRPAPFNATGAPPHPAGRFPLDVNALTSRQPPQSADGVTPPAHRAHDRRAGTRLARCA